MNKIRRFRFFLSWLIFEKILKWEPANKVAQEIIKETNNYNERHRQRHCYSCGGQKLASKLIGVDGLFSSVSQIYECHNCGNQQYSDGSDYISRYSELKKKRIIEDGNGYRYKLISEFMSFVLFLLFSLAVFWVPFILFIF